jgi:hypothetical protein
MNEKSIQADLAARAKKMHKEQVEEEARKEREQRRASRYERRYKNVHELALRNREVLRRARSVTKPIEKDHRYHPAVILGESPQTELTPHHMLICRLTYDRQRGYGSNGSVNFDFFHIRKKHDYLREIVESNQIPSLSVSERLHPNMVVLQDGHESTYIVGNKTKDDEISQRLQKHISGHLIEPISVIRRPIRMAAVSDRIDNLESTMEMLETAAMDASLNPFLSSRLERRGFAAAN